ncbi:MAG: glutamine amidotransferase [Pirellulaceae bacterium]
MIRQRQSALVLCLIDLSRSMELPHLQEDQTRWQALNETIDSCGDVVEALKQESVDVKFVGFDSDIQNLQIESGTPTLPETPEGGQTDIGNAVSESVREVRDQRIASVLLMSDGVQNVLDPKIELLDSISRLKTQEIPLIAVPFGIANEVGQFADVAITNLPDHDTVFVKNRKTVRATLVSRGFMNQPVTVQLVISRAGQQEQIVDTQVYVPDQSYQEQNIELSYTPNIAGSYRMSVRAVRLQGESATLNNELTSFLTVYEGGLRVLFISSLDNLEQSRIRRSLPAMSGGDANAGQGIEISYFPVMSDARTRERGWPLGQDLIEAIRDPAVDVIMINNVDSRALYRKGEFEGAMLAIEEAVANGKGLMMLGGPHSFGPGLYHSTPLADVLPVLMNPYDRQEFDRDMITDFHISGPVKPKPTSEWDILSLRSEGDFWAPWNELPPFPGINRFQGLKDNASVLLTSQNQEPVLVSGTYGSRGRVMAMAADATWLWYSHGMKREHQRFWQQMILWLAFPEGDSKDNVRIFLNQRRFQPKSQITFSTEARTVVGKAIENAEYKGILVSPDGSQSPISISGGEEYTGTIEPDRINQPGIYSIKVSATSGNDSIGTSEIEFSVYDHDKEKSNPAADIAGLTRIAGETSDFGGAVIQPNEVKSYLESLLNSVPELDLEIPQRWQLGSTLGDGAAFLALFVLVMGTEWYLRKRWGLV